MIFLVESYINLGTPHYFFPPKSCLFSFLKLCVSNLNLHLSVFVARWYLIQPVGWLVDVQISRHCNLVLCDLVSPLQILTVESIVFLLNIPSEGLHPDVEWYRQSNARCKWSGGEKDYNSVEVILTLPNDSSLYFF